MNEELGQQGCKYLHCSCGLVHIIEHSADGLRIVGRMHEGEAYCPNIPEHFKNMTEEEWKTLKTHMHELTKNHLYL